MPFPDPYCDGACFFGMPNAHHGISLLKGLTYSVDVVPHEQPGFSISFSMPPMVDPVAGRSWLDIDEIDPS